MIRKLIAAFAALLPLMGQAEILQLNYTNPDGVAVSRAPSQVYHNPASQISFAVSAGLDRMVRLTVLDSAGAVVHVQTSKLIGATDRITVDGKSYYGAYLSTPSLKDGAYTLRAEIINTSNVVVQTFNYSNTIDTVGPNIPRSMGVSESGYLEWVTTGDLWKLGRGSYTGIRIYLNEVTDSGSSVTKVTLEVKRADQQHHQTLVATYNQETKSAAVLSNSIFPDSDLDEIFTLQFTAYDEAGNRSKSNIQKVMHDGIANAPTEPFAVYEPGSDGKAIAGHVDYVPYVAGGVVKTNPIKLVWKIPKSNWHTYREGGLRISNAYGDASILTEDAASVYVTTTTPFGVNNHNYVRWINFGEWAGGVLQYNLTLWQGAPIGPIITLVEYEFSDIGWSSFFRPDIQNTVLPLSVQGIRVHAQARNYDQIAYHVGQCAIPAGQTSCIIPFTASLGKGTTGYLHNPAYVEKSDRSLRSNTLFAEVNWNDLNYPELETQYDTTTKKLVASIRQPGRGANNLRLFLSDAWIENTAGTRLTVSGGRTAEDGERYVYTWDLATLPEGTHDLVAVARENHGPTTKKSLFTIAVDRTAPGLNIQTPGEISALSEIAIGLTDAVDSAPQITSINLRGGPAAENVFLSWRSESQGLYRLEYPVMFPSMEAGHSYTIEVKAADASGNIATATKTFMFSPDTINLNANGKISVPALGRPVRRAQNEHVISSPEIRSNNVVISGSYELIVTLRSDAQSAAIVNGTRVSPGQTLLFPPYDFSATGGKIQLDVHAEDVTKTADMPLLIQTTQPGTPMLLATVTSFHEPLTYTTGTDAVQGIVPVSLQITKPGNSVCQLVSLQSAAAETFDPANPKCFLRSTSETSGAMSLVEAGNSQAGSIYINTTGTTTVGHKVVIYEGSGRTEVVLQNFERQVEVKPAMGAITHIVGPEKNELYHQVVAEKITLNNTAGFACNLVGSITEAKANAQTGLASLKCLVRWTEVPLGLQSAGSNLEGRFRNAGEQPVAWKTSVFTATGQEIVVQEGSDVLNVQTPPVPVPTDVDTLFGMQDGWRKGKDNIVFYSKSDRMNSIRVYAEARRYVQNVRFGSSSCQIPVGSVSCDLTVFYYAPAGVSDDGSTAETGFKREDIVLNTTTNYFANSSLLSADFKFDYRPPSVEQVVVGRTGEVVQINGASYPLSNDEILVVLKSPHGTMQTDRWKPASLSVAPIVQEGYEQSSVVNDGEESFLTNVPTISGVGNRLAQVGESVQDGTYFIYRFNSASVPDGMYVLDVVASDGNSNSGQRKLENVLLNRHAPAIAIFNQGRQIADKENVYFLSDLKVVAHGGWADGTTITKVLANSREIPMAGDKVNVKTVAATDFDPNQAMVLQVHATDAAGNEAIQNFNIQYMPVDFEFDGVPASLYQSVEAVRIGLRQTKGFKCKLATSDELAQLKSRGIYKGCTVEWQNLPSGLESIMLPTSFSLQGGIDALGDVEWGYKVFFHNAAGNKALAKQGSTKVTVVAADAPEFILSDLNKLEDGVYGVSYNSNKITRYELKTVPAVNVIKIKADNGEIDQEIILKQRLTKTPYSIRNDVKRPVVEGKMAWDKTTYHIDSFYQRNPQQKSSHTFDLITFPDGGVRAQLSLSEKEASAGNVILADLAVGRPIRGEFEYDIAKMGRWKAYLAIRENGAYTAVTNVVELTTTGIAKFELQAAELFNRADRVYAIVESISQYEQYKRTIVSNSARLAVFQSDAIAGDIDARTTQGRVPFSASMRFDYDDKNDKTASAPVGWEMSADLQQWTDMGVKAGQKMYSVRITEVGVTYYRVRMQNKMTQELSYTAPLRVIGYETPDIWIEGPDAVYEGGQATLTLFSDETSDIDSDGFAEWSVDGGVTWTAGDTVTTVDVPSDMKVFARYRLNTTDGEVGDDGYRTAEHRITVVPVKPVVLKASGPKHAEVGSTIQLTGSARHDNRNSQGEIISSWLSPSGKNLPGATVDYVVTAEDVQDGELGRFQFVAYVQGLENETKASADVSIALWSYSLPEVKLALISRIQIAPATIAARVDTPYFYAPGVELSYEWLLPESITVDRSTSSLTYLVAQNAGVQKIGIRVQDNRGNSKEIFEFVDIVEADPLVMGVELRPSNTFERAPVSYSAKTNAKPGHPDDSIASYAWLLDGVVLEGQSKPYANVQITEPGEYKLTVKFKTDFGQEGEIDKLLTVVPNKPPVCEPFITDTSSSITVNANCKDEDGKIISLKYGWREDGYESSGGTRLRFTKSLHQSLNVRIRATDDSGAETLTEIKWTNPAIVQP